MSLIVFEKETKNLWFWKKKVADPIPIPKLDLGFGSGYQNLVSVTN